MCPIFFLLTHFKFTVKQKKIIFLRKCKAVIYFNNKCKIINKLREKSNKIAENSFLISELVNGAQYLRT